MSSKNAASTIVGISMGQDICLIHGQVSLNLLCWKRNLPTDICGLMEEINEKTAYIQARSFMARILDEIGKTCPVEGEAKVVTRKTKGRQCKKIARNFFIDPEDKGF